MIKFQSKRPYFQHGLLSLVLCITACGTNDDLPTREINDNFQIKNDMQTEPSVRPSPGHQLTAEEINSLPQPDKSFQYVQGQPTKEAKPMLNYFNTELGTKILPVKDYSKYLIEPGIIEIVLKDSYGLRLHKNEGSPDVELVSSANPQAAQTLNSYLKTSKIRTAYDLGEGMSEAEIDADQARIKSVYDGDIPSRHSIQTYLFPKDTELMSIIKELRTLPFVRSANLVYNSELSVVTKTSLGTINDHATNPANNGSAPSDPGFVPANEENDWWWFQRHKVFAGWTLWDQVGTPQPTIAVIDSGFDTAAPSAWDKPNYLAGKRFNGCSSSTVCATIDTTVTEPTHPSVDLSHGTLVSALAASPRNNGYRYAGVAPGANIYPVRVMEDTGGTILSNNTAAGIRHAASVSGVDVINISLASARNTCPVSSANHAIRTEIAAAISAGKIVVAAAGNYGYDLQNQPTTVGYPYPPGTPNTCVYSNNPDYLPSTGGEIIVGGVASDTTPAPKRTKGWFDYPSSASNYDSSAATSVSIVDIAAAASVIMVPIFDPNTNMRKEERKEGTSLATPMVAATAGMMKKIAQHSASGIPSVTLNHYQVKGMLVGSADVSRYTGGYTSADETRFLGENLDYQTGRMVGVRSLNVHNALLLARYTKIYPIVTRLYNADDVVQFTHNYDWTTPARKDLNYGYDTFWGVSGLTSGDVLNFRVNNTFVSGYAYGYNIFRYNTLWFQSFAGVSGVAGAELNATKPIGYYGGVTYTY